MTRTHPTPIPHQDRSNFIAHAGLAFGIFHRFIFEPFKAGVLRNPAPKATLSKAGGAGMTAFSELLQAKQFAQRGTALRELYAPLASVGAMLHELSKKLHAGRPDRADIVSANSAIASIERSASASGVKITERAPATAP